MSKEQEKLARWRLILGAGSESALGGFPDRRWGRMDTTLAYLYDRECGASRNIRPRHGGQGDSSLTVPDWINEVHELFPRKTIERLEKDALERYQLEGMVTNPEVLSRAQPSTALLKAVLHTKHLMNQEVLALARDMVRRVVEELMRKLAREVRTVFVGAAARRQRSFIKVAKNFDLARTLKANLKHYDGERRKLVIQTPYFFSRIKRQSERWRIIILVDQSGSMLDSVIHSAVTAAIFFGIKALDTRLVLFDTNIVDISADCTDPVATLMKVQLGGGTDIGGALHYARQLVDAPHRTIVVLISDFYEGGPIQRLFATAKELLESGVTLLGLAALDADARPSYDQRIAQTLVNMGAHVGAMTPGELAQWIAQKVR